MRSLFIRKRPSQHISILPSHARQLQPERQSIRIEPTRPRHRRNSNPIHPSRLTIRPRLRRTRHRLVIRRLLQRRVNKSIQPPSLHRRHVLFQSLLLRPVIVLLPLRIGLNQPLCHHRRIGITLAPAPHHVRRKRISRSGLILGDRVILRRPKVPQKIIHSFPPIRPRIHRAYLHKKALRQNLFIDHHRSSRRPQLLHRFHKRRPRLRHHTSCKRRSVRTRPIHRRRPLHHKPRHTKPLPLQRIFLQIVGIRSRLRLRRTPRRPRIQRILCLHHSQRNRRTRHISRQRPRIIPQPIQRLNPRNARQPSRRQHPHQAIIRRRLPYRVRRIPPRSQPRKVRRHRRRRPTRRPTRRVPHIISISRPSARRTNIRIARRKVRHIRLSQNPRARLLQPSHHHRIPRRHQLLPRLQISHPPRARHQPLHTRIRLHHNRHTPQRSVLRTLRLRIFLGRPAQRALRIHMQQRPIRPVIPRNPI